MSACLLACAPLLAADLQAQTAPSQTAKSQTAPSAATTSTTCARGDFEAVVDDAAQSLRTLNADNKPRFQLALRDLKQKRGWDHAQFLKEAAPFVRDEQISVYDDMSQKLLMEIAELGQSGSEAAQPDCALLVGLRGRMDKLVTAQKEKWAYMFGKLKKALD
ncbi:MAG: hypothetical protein AAGG72_06525 [Pseudomonadota bacterium]